MNDDATLQEVLRRLKALEEGSRALRREMGALRRRVEALEGRRSKAGLGPGEDWYTAWRREAPPVLLQRAEALIRVMGDTGLCLRKDLVAKLQEAGAISESAGPRSRQARKPFDHLLDWEIIERVTAKREGGRGPRVEFFRLTERGRHAYRVLFGGEPVESLYDRLLARHRSPEHVWLNLQAAEILRGWATGYVNLFPVESDVRGIGYLAPDIEVFPPDPEARPIFVECERGCLKKPEERRRKWEIYHQVGQGRLYIFVPSKAVQEAIRKEIRRWAREAEANVHLHVCNISEWQRERSAGKRAADDPPWTLEEEYRYAWPGLFNCGCRK